MVEDAEAAGPGLEYVGTEVAVTGTLQGTCGSKAGPSFQIRPAEKSASGDEAGFGPGPGSDPVPGYEDPAGWRDSA